MGGGDPGGPRGPSGSTNTYADTTARFCGGREVSTCLNDVFVGRPALHSLELCHGAVLLHGDHLHRHGHRLPSEDCCVQNLRLLEDQTHPAVTALHARVRPALPSLPAESSTPAQAHRARPWAPAEGSRRPGGNVPPSPRLAQGEDDGEGVSCVGAEEQMCH